MCEAARELMKGLPETSFPGALERPSICYDALGTGVGVELDGGREICSGRHDGGGARRSSLFVVVEGGAVVIGRFGLIPVLRVAGKVGALVVAVEGIEFVLSGV